MSGDKEAGDRTQRIQVRKADNKRVVALSAHLRPIFWAVLRPDQRFTRPVEADHADLLLASASLRALLFDDRASPILLDFLKEHELQVEVETLETNLGMLLLPYVEPDEGHISDYFLEILLSPEMREEFPLATPKQILISAEASRAYRSLARRPDVWLPSRAAEEIINSGICYSNRGGPIQLCEITRKVVPLAEWGNVRLGYLKDKAIRRRNLLTYVANKLGGVHYDPARLPANDDDRDEFKILALAYDWEHEALMHAGLVAVALGCVELCRTPDLMKLLVSFEKFHQERQTRLRRRNQAQDS